MTDYEVRAVTAWVKIESDKREFAENAAKSNLPASHIAQAVRDAGGDCSDSLALKYINAYRLYARMQAILEEPELITMWATLSPTHWIRLAEKESVYPELTLEKCFEHLCTIMDTRISAAGFAAFLDNTYNSKSKWVRDLERTIELLSRFDKLDYVSEIPPKVRERLRRIFGWAAKMIKRELEREDE